MLERPVLREVNAAETSILQSLVACQSYLEGDSAVLVTMAHEDRRFLVLRNLEQARREPRRKSSNTSYWSIKGKARLQCQRSTLAEPSEYYAACWYSKLFRLSNHGVHTH
jgi:hypothetical protein